MEQVALGREALLIAHVLDLFGGVLRVEVVGQADAGLRKATEDPRLARLKQCAGATR